MCHHELDADLTELSASERAEIAEEHTDEELADLGVSREQLLA
ncbi:hypothetical protein [Halomarina oriensis]|uniref:DUF1127 domain-containing protein n=1 Tax=Halomarina oriensis TaxID=671145 RepID=A0A6B0GRC0_9EURY|nr:hypothetical protein [Halomarina oriensis]MWG34665.1 DUF1127 domain-containing protein [Halomarina oriensis]